MRCGAVGRDRWRRLAFPFVSIPVLQDRGETRSEAGPGALRIARARACALAEQPNAAARLIGGRAIRSESIDIGVAVEAQDGIMVPVIRNADKTSLADLTSRYTRTGGSCAQTPAQLRTDVRRNRVRFEFRNVRARLGNADSAARSDAVARTRRREKSAVRGAKRSSNSCRSTQAELTLELRSSQPRRRWRGTIAQTHRRTAGGSGEALGSGTQAHQRVPCGSRARP